MASSQNLNFSKKVVLEHAINEKTLKEEGWEEGKKIGNEIKRLRYINIDNY